MSLPTPGKQLLLGFRLFLTAYCLLLTAAAAPLTFAQVPRLIRYQGMLKDAQGVPLEGPYTLTFRLYAASSGGTALWTETQSNVPVSTGSFGVLLGQVTALDSIDWSQPCWLSIQVNTEAELSPRQQITSVPLAIRAETAEIVKTSGLTDDANSLVPAGGIILWDGASCPVGYARLFAYDDKFLVGSTSAGTIGGSNTHDHSGQTGSHTLTISEIPSHTHTAPSSIGQATGATIFGGATNTDNTLTTNATGGGQGHTHPISPTDNRPAFRTILLCKRN